MIPLRKEHAGSCNLGYTWPEDGSVVEVTPEHAQLLLAVPDGDFTAVSREVAGGPSRELQIEEPAAESATPIEEPAPGAPISEAPPPRKATARKAAARKAMASEPEAPAAAE